MAHHRVAAADQEVESLNPFISNVQELGSLRLALGYNIAAARKGADSLTDLDMNLRLTPTDFLNFVIRRWGKPRVVGDHPGSGDYSVRGSSSDYTADIGSGFLETEYFPYWLSLLGQWAEWVSGLERKYQLGSGATGASRELYEKSHHPRCPFAPNPKSILGDLVTGVFYHVTDNILMNVNSTYSISTNKLIGVRGAVKLLSPCDCWTLTLAVNQTINPAQTSFSFNFSLLGLGAQKRNTL